METFNAFTDGFFSSLAPELVLFIGLILVILIPNLGNSTFRIPSTGIRVPWFLGGKRFSLTADPRIPGYLTSLTLAASFVLIVLSQASEASIVLIQSDSGMDLLKIDGFSRLFEMLFIGAILAASLASLDRLPSKKGETDDADTLYNNRRQVDFYILLLTTAIGMSIVALAQDLFILFIGLELASLSTYVLVAFQKESKSGSEAGVKYFIVGSVASGVGLYGLSLLYLWAGSLQFDVLSAAWDSGASALALVGLGMVLVGFGFKVSAVPFHFAAPDAYAGASSTVAGLLATASKAMGMLGLIRLLVVIAIPDGAEGSAVWLITLAVVSAITMTWGNIAALGSNNPKRMLAYSSVAHAGYMLAALTAVGSWRWGHVAAPVGFAEAILGAIVFHLVVLVAFKMGAFLVLALLEMEGGASRLSSLAGLGRREPLLAACMFIFMLSLAGVPPLAGFLSKFLLIAGIVKMSIGDLSTTIAQDGALSLGSLHWIWWFALLIFINSAISLFYYLRVVVVMFFDEAEEGRKKPLPKGFFIRATIWGCAIATILFGIGGDTLVRLCFTAVENLQL